MWLYEEESKEMRGGRRQKAMQKEELTREGSEESWELACVKHVLLLDLRFLLSVFICFFLSFYCVGWN